MEPQPAAPVVRRHRRARDDRRRVVPGGDEVLTYREMIARFSDAIQRTAVPLGGANDVPAAGSLTVSVAGSLSVATLSRQGRELFTVVCAYAGWETPR